MSVGSKIAVGFGTALALLIAVVIGSYRSVVTLNESASRIEGTHQRLDELGKMLSHVVEAEAAARTYVITGDSHCLEAMESARSALHDSLASVRGLVSESAEQRHHLRALEPLITDKLSLMTELVQLRQTGDTDRAVRLIRVGVGKQAMDDVRQVFDQMEAIERTQLVRDVRVSKADAAAVMIRNLLLCFLACSFVATSGFLIHRDFVRRQRAEQALRNSQSQLQSILDNATAIVYVKNLDGRFLLVNRKFESVFGRSKDSVVGRTGRELSEAIPDSFSDEDRRVIESRAPLQSEDTVLQPDGHHTYLSIRFPLCHASGAPYATCGISTDITERKRMEKTLKEKEERLSRILETITDGVFILDGSGVVTFANSRAESMFGVSRDVMSERRPGDPAWKMTSVAGAPVSTDQYPFTHAVGREESPFDTEIAVGRGSTFKFTLPLVLEPAPVLPAPLSQASDPVADAGASFTDSTSPSPSASR